MKDILKITLTDQGKIKIEVDKNEKKVLAGSIITLLIHDEELMDEIQNASLEITALKEQKKHNKKLT